MTTFSKDVLKLDLEAKSAELSEKLQTAVLKTLKRRGLVVAVSGGIDSACCLALGVRALGPRRVFGLLLPERDSSGESTSTGGSSARRWASSSSWWTSRRCSRPRAATAFATRRWPRWTRASSRACRGRSSPPATASTPTR